VKAVEGAIDKSRNRYNFPHLSGERTVYKIGVNFSREKRTIDAWERG
jgi:hypothetical protein